MGWLVTFVGLACACLLARQVPALTLRGSWPTAGPPLGITSEPTGTLLLSTSTAIPPYLRYTPQGVRLSQMGWQQYTVSIFGLASESNGDFFVAYYQYGFRFNHYRWNGEFLRGAGGPQGGAESAKYLAWLESSPCGVPPCGDLFVTDPVGGRVLRFRTASGGHTFVSSWTSQQPSGVVARDGAVFVASHDGGFITRYTTQGATVASFATGAVTAEGLAAGPDGRLYLADRGGGGDPSRLLVFSPTGTLIDSVSGTVNGYPYGPPEFVGVTVDANGTIYATDHANGRVMVFDQGPTASRTMSWGRIKSLYR